MHDPYDALDDLYDEWVISVIEDVPFYVAVAEARRAELGLAPGQRLRVLELGAGNGRITLVLALRGHSVIALDTASGQLARLRASLAGADVPDDHVQVLEGDMRNLGALVARASVDLVVAPFRSLLHVAPERDRVFAGVRRALVPGGMFAFDVFHPNPLNRQTTDGAFELRRRFERRDGRWSVWERADFAPDGRSLDLHVRCERRDDHDDRLDARQPDADDDARTDPAECRVAHMHLETPTPHEWQSALEASGLHVESVSGWFDERPLQPGDEDSVWVARA